MKAVVDTKWLVVWKHEGNMAVWVRNTSQVCLSPYGRVYAGVCDREEWTEKHSDMTRHEAEELLKLNWGVEVPATEDDVGRMVMVTDYDVGNGVGPYQLLLVDSRLRSPYVVKNGDFAQQWRYARLATKEECEGVEE